MSFHPASHAVPSSPCRSIQPPMSFLRGYVRKRESMGGGAKKEKPYCDGLRKHRLTTSNLRFPSPRSAQRGNDMLSEACSCLSGDDIAVEACLNLKDTSIQPPMSFQQRYVGKRESMGGGTKKLKTYCDGLRKHRFHAPLCPARE